MPVFVLRNGHILAPANVAEVGGLEQDQEPGEAIDGNRINILRFEAALAVLPLLIGITTPTLHAGDRRQTQGLKLSSIESSPGDRSVFPRELLVVVLPQPGVRALDLLGEKDASPGIGGL